MGLYRAKRTKYRKQKLIRGPSDTRCTQEVDVLPNKRGAHQTSTWHML